MRTIGNSRMASRLQETNLIHNRESSNAFSRFYCQQQYRLLFVLAPFDWCQHSLRMIRMACICIWNYSVKVFLIPPVGACYNHGLLSCSQGGRKGVLVRSVVDERVHFRHFIQQMAFGICWFPVSYCVDAVAHDRLLARWIPVRSCLEDNAVF